MKLSKKHADSEPAVESPVGDLEEILSGAGEDSAALFSAALSLYAGPFAVTKTDDEKYADLERLIMGSVK